MYLRNAGKGEEIYKKMTEASDRINGTCVHQHDRSGSEELHDSEMI
jgi:hypothetical protein